MTDVRIKFLSVWPWVWKGTISTLGISAAIYYGLRRVLETWRWYCFEIRDRTVLQLIERRKMVPDGSWTVFNREPHPTKELPYSVSEIANALKRKEKSVNRSLKRLRTDGKVELFEDGWRVK